MALIVNFAHAATWKIRSATSARLAMWRHRPMWNADGDPNPVNYWPQGASLSVSGGSRVSQVDDEWNQPAIVQLWIKGPVFAVQDGYLGVRNNRVNEMSEGVSKGTANVSLRYPFMPSMGNITMNAEHSLLDSAWQFHTMGYGWNEARRAKGWWQLEDSPDWASQKQVFMAANSRLLDNPQKFLMTPLDRDEELMRFYGHSSPGSDFYSQIHFCDNNPQNVRDQEIILPGRLLDRIRGSKALQVAGVCERMAKSYLKMYQTELMMLLAMPDPPADRVAQLKVWIKQLSDFIAKL